MGKQGRQRNKVSRRERGASYYLLNDEDEQQQQQQRGHSSNEHYPPSPFSVSNLTLSDNEKPPPQQQHEDYDDDDEDTETSSNKAVFPSKFSLYQQSVQSPKGDISYLQKFFLVYVGGRMPLHLQEDFCGTALLSAEWLRSDSRRTAIGLDFDIEALNWCIDNNIDKIGSRIYLFHGNVLSPSEAILVNSESKKLTLHNIINDEGGEDRETEETLPGRDIICAFNYSCCCLHSRVELVSYFKHSRNALSREGGIFVMDLYGGKSSECELRLQRKFPNFTYVWEQAGFDIIHRKTRISLHFHLQKPKRKLPHAFSYSWRLWSLPEIKDCLEEAGFGSVHFWMRQMPNSEDIRSIKGFGSGRDIKYEEVGNFEQQDSWNAYIVAVA